MNASIPFGAASRSRYLQANRQYGGEDERQRDADNAGTQLSEHAEHAGHAGLGLWIVQRNVEALGGRVGAANRIGGGLSVTITLPRNGL